MFLFNRFCLHCFIDFLIYLQSRYKTENVVLHAVRVCARVCLSMITPVGVKFQSSIKVKSISHFQFLFRLIGIVIGTHISWCSSLVDWIALLWNVNRFALFFSRRLWVLQQHQRSRVSFVKEIYRLSSCMLCDFFSDWNLLLLFDNWWRISGSVECCWCPYHCNAFSFLLLTGFWGILFLNI